jgi:hypothetical protein
MDRLDVKIRFVATDPVTGDVKYADAQDFYGMKNQAFVYLEGLLIEVMAKMNALAKAQAEAKAGNAQPATPTDSSTPRAGKPG